MNKLTLTDHFRRFLSDRPAISPDRLAGELGMDRTNMGKIIIGQRKIPQHRRGAFSRIMAKYGYSDHIKSLSQTKAPSPVNPT